MRILVSVIISLSIAKWLCAYEAPPIPYAPAAGEGGSTAIAHDDSRILSWAVAVTDLQFGSNVEESNVWMDPANALGPAGATNPSVLVLGRGGFATLEFAPTIRDGAGYDFAVFENGFSDTFLELAYVEVSSDGEHFVRFPNYSLTNEPVGSWGHVSATFVHGFAGKYRVGFGTPFDLAVLKGAYEAALAGGGGFSDAYRSALLANYPFLDLESIRYVRLMDIIGDGTFMDCEGFAVYDPYPTFITAGFDLDGIGVLNQGAVEEVGFSEWSAGFGLPSIADADSDHDGWNQYLEYLLGSHPNNADSIPSVRQEISGNNIYRVRFTTSAIATGVAVVQTSRDGIEWTERDTEIFARNGLLEWREFLLDLGSSPVSPLFVRLLGIPE